MNTATPDRSMEQTPATSVTAMAAPTPTPTSVTIVRRSRRVSHFPANEAVEARGQFQLAGIASPGIARQGGRRAGTGAR